MKATKTNFLSEAHRLLISRFGQIGRLMGQAIENKLAPVGITYQEMRIAGLLMGEEAITQKDLAEKLSVRPATLSVAISKLEAQGLVERIPSQTDRRVNYLHLKSGDKITQVDNLLRAVESDITRGISQKDLDITAKVLVQIISNFKRQQ